MKISWFDTEIRMIPCGYGSNKVWMCFQVRDELYASTLAFSWLKIRFNKLTEDDIFLTFPDPYSIFLKTQVIPFLFEIKLFEKINPVMILDRTLCFGSLTNLGFNET